MKVLFTLCMVMLCLSLDAQKNNIPEWFLKDIQQMKGVWIADNSEYKSQEEPYVVYINEWEPGIDDQSLMGKLCGKTEAGEKVLFWEFRQFWDNETQEAKILQFGNGNVLGQGKMYPVQDEKMESIQVFSLADGRKWTEKHHTTLRKDTLITTSFDQKEDMSWSKKRTYHWIKQEKEDLGKFSMSLAVNDLQKSYAFYNALGFQIVGGKMEQNWLILKHNNIKIGLFKGMFPTNTITFNPMDARHFYRLLKDKGVNILFEQGVDKAEGPCSFSFLDPDGNPILIDQHN